MTAKTLGLLQFPPFVFTVLRFVIMPYLLLTPVLAVVFGVLVWGDRPGWRLLAGALWCSPASSRSRCGRCGGPRDRLREAGHGTC